MENIQSLNNRFQKKNNQLSWSQYFGRSAIPKTSHLH